MEKLNLSGFPNRYLSGVFLGISQIPDRYSNLETPCTYGLLVWLLQVLS